MKQTRLHVPVARVHPDSNGEFDVRCDTCGWHARGLATAAESRGLGAYHALYANNVPGLKVVDLTTR